MTSVAVQDIDALLSRVPKGLLIGDSWRNSSDGSTFDVENPATGEIIATLASASSEDARAALDAACSVQEEWARTSPRHRSNILRDAFNLVQERAEDFATLMTLEMGKPLAEAHGEVIYGNEFLRWFSEEAVRNYGRYGSTPEDSHRMITVRKPVGPCLLITPWNFPLAMATRKIAPAIAAGCVMVVKPARLTPLTTQYFAKTMLDAGLPAGVLNVVAGSSASAISDPILEDPRLRKVSFTGSTPVGQQLLKKAADNVLRTSMELGGNAPFIVFDDADLELAVEGALNAKMRNTGEACTAANRFIVHESIAEEFGQRFASKLNALTMGNGLSEGVTVGPLIEEKARTNIASLVHEAITDGARVLTGGNQSTGPGYFYSPTVLVDVPAQSRILHEEIFGPVAPIITFTSESEAISLANDTEFGLASYVFTQDTARIFRVSDQLEFGLLGINSGIISNAAAPFGGLKQSGMGKEGGIEGIDEYTSLQYLAMPNPYR